MEEEYRNISPLYMQRLKERVEDALWNLFTKSKYRQVEEYVGAGTSRMTSTMRTLVYTGKMTI